jgi:hypothetical protein
VLVVFDFIHQFGYFEVQGLTLAGLHLELICFEFELLTDLLFLVTLELVHFLEVAQLLLQINVLLFFV